MWGPGQFMSRNPDRAGMPPFGALMLPVFLWRGNSSIIMESVTTFEARRRRGFIMLDAAKIPSKSIAADVRAERDSR
jgi:hypothetical protein